MLDCHKTKLLTLVSSFTFSQVIIFIWESCFLSNLQLMLMCCQDWAMTISGVARACMEMNFKLLSLISFLASQRKGFSKL